MEHDYIVVPRRINAYVGFFVIGMLQEGLNNEVLKSTFGTLHLDGLVDSFSNPVTYRRCVAIDVN